MRCEEPDPTDGIEMLRPGRTVRQVIMKGVQASFNQGMAEEKAWRYEQALERIKDIDPIDAALDPQRAIRIADAALAGERR